VDKISKKGAAAHDTDDILNEVFNTNNPVVYFPVRHHSPACSYHVKRAIALYNPDCILIEGPCDTDSLIPCLTTAQAPVSIYYSYSDNEGKHACYYPMLDFSPELVAVRQAVASNIPVHFIDLPYGNMIHRRREAGDVSTDTGEYFNEYFLQRSRYIELLCERENCRHYNELWEKLFELPAPKLSTEVFIRNLTAMCYFSRIDYPDELLTEENNDIRESFMAQMILKHRKSYSRVLVITGGFHTARLMELVADGKPDKVKPLRGEAYLIPYSFTEADRLTGYESGMPYPGFCQSLYERLDAKTDNLARGTVLEYIAKLAKVLRKHRESVSLSEEIAAFAMCGGLADLRDKPCAGVYELMDSVRTTFIKGELNLSTSFVLKQATKVLRGTKVGKVGEDAPIPPIVVDFISIARSYRMETASTTRKQLTLDIVSKPKHRKQSMFLHRLQFLDNPYARKTFGPDYEGQRNTKLIREKWNLAFSGRVTSALIEKSHLGGTVAEACGSLLSEHMKEHCGCSADAANLLIRAGVMGLFTHTEKLLQAVTERINDDHSFISLTRCLKSLSFLQGIEHILRIEKAEQIRAAKVCTLKRAVPMLYSLTAADEKEDYELAQAIKILHRTAMNEPDTDNDYLTCVLADLLDSKDIPPAVDGAVTGLICAPETVLKRADAYFTATGEILSLSGRFLRGLFLTAKDVLFYDDGDGLVGGLNAVIKRWQYDEFMQVLPDLRLAFTSFTPLEIDRIAKKVSAVLGLTETTLTTLPAIGEEEYKIIRAADERVMKLL
jgi:hypothetical protein